MKRKNFRTPRWWIAGKMTLLVWAVLWCCNWLMGEDFFSFTTTAATVFGWMWGISFAIQFMGFVLFGTEEEYQKGRRRGWHPYWDLLPPPINNDCTAVRLGGIPEPKTSFTPPEDWSLQCLRCGARNEDWATQCWECKAEFIPGPPPTPEPRYCYCCFCNKKFYESKYGDLEKGVYCPHCKNLVHLMSANERQAQQ